MNKKEKKILLEEYGYQYSVVSSGYDKDIRFYQSILDKLGLYNDRIKIENEVYLSKMNLKYIQLSTYDNILEILSKYNDGKIIKVEELDMFLDEIKYELTEEHKKCLKASLKIINSNIRL